MTPVSERYAEALFTASEDLGCTRDMLDELTAMDELMDQCGGMLRDPLIGTGVKVALLRELLSGAFSPLMLEFILIMTGHRHLKHFHRTAEHYRQISGYGKTVVRLRVPFRPDASMLEQLKARFVKEKLIPEGAVETEFEVVEDEGLIGGLVASCNGFQLDTSLRTALRKMK